MPGQNVNDAAFECVPPEFRRTGRSHEYNRHTDINTSHSFDEISPITISQGEFRDDHGPSRAELSKSTAALMLRAHCITSP
jgi:hypothetical protein